MATSNLDKLTKSIDALTYNSRSVLNALIRSCMAAGSSTGYTVRRYGKEIVLDRSDIYKLYDFYQTWANGTMGYDKYTSDSDEFSAILSACDAKWSGTETVTSALVKHSQIMNLTNDNINNDSNSYWTDLVRTSTSPKVIVNSAPIPLNLRTPLYDENLSTKSFSQYETYLFPMGYYQSAILGTPGDGEDRVGAAKTWLFDIEDIFKVSANHIILGSNKVTESRTENYKNSKYTLSYGTDCYALGDNALSGGQYNVASATDSAIVGGADNLALSAYSFIGGGNGNIAAATGAGIIGGDDNYVTGYDGFAANRQAHAGDYAYPFVVDESSTAGETTECTTIADTTTGVCYASSATNSITDTTGRSTIRIYANDVYQAALSGPRLAIGDKVAIFAQTRKYNGVLYDAYQANGYTYPVWYYTITNITLEASSQDWLITLSGSLPSGESINSIWVNGGKIARISSSYYETKYDGTLYSSKSSINYGENSTALNFNTIAAGVNQTAVGQMNVPNIDAKFIVGIGSSYVTNGALRRNGFVVSAGYSYMQTANRNAIIGVTEYNGVYYRDYDGKNIRHGAFMLYDDETYTGETRVSSYYTKIGLQKDGTGAETNSLQFCRTGSSYLSKNFDVTTMLESRAGTLVISSGSYTSSTYNVDVLLDKGILRDGENGMAMYSEDGIEIRNTNESREISIHNSGYVSMTFKGLFLNGDTWGTLPTDENSRSHWVYHNSSGKYNNPHLYQGRCVDYVNVIAQSGFFYGTNGWTEGKTPAAGRVNLPSKVDGTNWEAHQGRGLHIINSAVSYIGGYDVSCLVLPGYVDVDEVSNPPHPKFINSFIYGTGNQGVMPTRTYVTEELAYMSDVKKLQTSLGGAAAYISSSNTSYVLFRSWKSSGSTPSWGDQKQPCRETGTSSSLSMYDWDTQNGDIVKWGNIAVKTTTTTSTSVSVSASTLFTGLPSINRNTTKTTTDTSIYVCGPLVYPGLIQLKRIGDVVVAEIGLAFLDSSVDTAEIIIKTDTNLCETLGITNDTVVMQGSTIGAQVTATLSTEISDGNFSGCSNALRLFIQSDGKVECRTLSLVGVLQR